MRAKGPLIPRQRPTRRELADRLYEARRLLSVGILAVLLVALGWYGYRTLQAKREDAAQALLTKALQVLEEASEASEPEENQGTKRDPEEALALLAQLRDEHPSSTAAEEALLQIGHISYQLGRYQDALGAYQGYLEEYPRGRWVFLAGIGRAYAMEALGQYTVAASIFRTLAERYQDHSLTVEALIGLARCLEHTQQGSEALAVYRRVLERYPGTTWSRQAEEKMAVLERSGEEE